MITTVSALPTHADYDKRTKTFYPLGFGLEFLLPTDVKSGDAWDITLKPYRTKEKLSSDILGNQIFITSKSEPVSQIYGNVVWTLLETTETTGGFGQRFAAPNTRSETIVTYFNHLFVVSDRKLFWSDLDNPYEWFPLQSNESDFRVIEWEKNNITTLAVIEDQLFIHTPSAMYQAVYTGKPNIINIRNRFRNAGCVKPRLLQIHGQVQYFLGSDNFYLWSPDHGLTPIGHEVWSKFLQRVTNLDEAWSYLDRKNNEIGWVVNDRIFVFNYLERHWSVFATDEVKSHISTSWTRVLDSSCLSRSIMNPDQNTIIENLWVSDSCLCRELRNGECGSVLSYSVPYLETDEFTYGFGHFEKRTDLVFVDCNFVQPWVALVVKVCGKEFVTQDKDYKTVGEFRFDVDFKHVDFQSVHGKVLKFRFELKDGRGLTKLNGGQKLNGKFLETFDGSIKMNKTRRLRNNDLMSLGWQSINSGYRDRFGFFELNSWGERVDIPSAEVGPDK